MPFSKVKKKGIVGYFRKIKCSIMDIDTWQTYTSQKLRSALPDLHRLPGAFIPHAWNGGLALPIIL